MSKSTVSRLAAVALASIVGYTMVPGCVIKIGPGIGDDRSGSDSSEDETTGGSTEDPGGDTQTPEEVFAHIDPQELALASAKASFVSCYMAGLVDSSGIDPATVDEATVAQLMEQYLPLASGEADKWLATIDPATLPLVQNKPRWDCTDQWQCAYHAKCRNAPFANLNHNCWVNDCGDARCGVCPEWFPEFLKKLALHSWCSYVCVEQVAYGKVVAVGAGAVTAPFKVQVEPYCFPPP